MQGKAPATICPHCGSREFWPSRKRLPESLLGPILPYRPFRCRACLKRYLVAKPWAWAALAALVVLVVGAGLLLRFGGPDLRNVAQQNPAPPVAADTVPAAPAPPAPSAASSPPQEKPRAAPQGPAKAQDSLLFRVHVHIPPAVGAGKAQ